MPTGPSSRRRNLTVTVAALIAASIGHAGCVKRDHWPATGPGTTQWTEPLLNWSDGATKTATLGYITRATTNIPVAERVAVLDIDGTLLPEYPAPPEVAYAIHCVNAQASQHPDWPTTPPFSKAINFNPNAPVGFTPGEIYELLSATHEGKTIAQFNRSVQEWFANTEHPKFNRPYNHLMYLPMSQLIQHLSDSKFRVCYVTAGSRELAAQLLKDTQCYSPGSVISSMPPLPLKINQSDPPPPPTTLPIPDEATGKPIAIAQFLGFPPALIAGNSDADLPTFNWVKNDTTHERFILIVKHNDANREYSYGANAPFGALDQALTEATVNNWAVAAISPDWLGNLIP